MEGSEKPKDELSKKGLEDLKTNRHKHIVAKNALAQASSRASALGTEQPKLAKLRSPGPEAPAADRGASLKRSPAEAGLGADQEGSSQEAGKLDAALGNKKRRANPEVSAGAEAFLAASQSAVAQPSMQKPALAKPGEKSENPALEAADKGKKTSSSPRLEISDLRKARQKKEGLAETAEPPKAPPVEEKGAVRELRLELGRSESGAKAEAFSPGGSEKTPATGTDFSSLLADKLRESWNGEIVKSAHIILKDGDLGTIRLRLRPESLGNVKIELNLAENNISGRIVVESDEAKNAFERSMAELQDAFREGGFDSAKLEVSVGSGDPRGGEGTGGEAATGPFWSERRRGAAFAEAVPQAAPIAGRAERALDILA